MRQILFFFLVLNPTFVLSQNVITGVLKDSLTHEAIEYASISLFENGNVNEKMSITGVISDSLGYFKLEKIPKGNYILQIQSMGYNLKEISIDFTQSQHDIDLGRLELSVNENVLNELVIEGENRTISLKPDKKIINIDNSMSAAGQSIADILQILPEIRVDNELITLKNQSFLVYLNGKPSSISNRQLFQMPASTIEKIEVIANPSVKYSPDGLGGIVNIILKKRILGINGILQAAARTDNNYGGAFTFNYGLEKFNFFTTFYPRYYNTATDGYSYTNRKENDYLKENSSKQQEYFNESFTLGFDYDITSKDLTTVYWTQFYIQGKYTDKIISESEEFPLSVHSYTDNIIDADYLTKQNTLSFNYKHLFNAPGTEFSFDFIQSFATNPQNRKFIIEDRTGNPIKQPYKISPSNKNNRPKLTANFASRLLEKIDLNMNFGVDLALNKENYKNEGATYAAGFWQDSLSIRNFFLFNEYITGSYVTFDFSVKKFSFVLGTRLEHYETQSRLENTKNNNNAIYNFYPSFAASYKLNDYNEFNFNGNRRIDRPSAFQLNPFVYTGDYVDELYTGNANLQPSFSGSFELGYSFNKNSFGINTSLSYVETKNVIDRMFYQIEERRYRTWGNISDIKSYMIDAGLYWQYKVFSAYLTGSAGKGYYSKKTGEDIIKENFLNYDIRFFPRIKLKKGYDFSLQMIYYGPRNYAYSKRTEDYKVSLSASKTFNKKLTLSVYAVNLINKIARRYVWGEQFDSELFTNMHDRSLHIGILYKFGKEVKTRAKASMNTNVIQLNR